mgnify:CR=1 FL=1
MSLFGNFDVYERSYTYDEMKVMCVIGECCDDYDCCLNYEDLCRISEAIYAHWIDVQDECEEEKYEKYPWLDFKSEEEYGYIQAYAQRVLPEFIKLYKETTK